MRGRIQIDGREHEWFEERAACCTLLGFVDDATSALMEPRSCESESALCCCPAMRFYLTQHGKPGCIADPRVGRFAVVGILRSLRVEDPVIKANEPDRPA